ALSSKIVKTQQARRLAVAGKLRRTALDVLDGHLQLGNDFLRSHCREAAVHEETGCAAGPHGHSQARDGTMVAQRLYAGHPRHVGARPGEEAICQRSRRALGAHLGRAWCYPELL
ncbi:unnamed protein product, partial [Ectocarpus fasciculatus]